MGVDEGVNLGVRHWFAPGIPTIGANRESTGGAGLGWGDPCSPVSWRGLFEDPWWDPFGELWEPGWVCGWWRHGLADGVEGLTWNLDP